MSPVRPASEWPNWAGGETRVLPTLPSWLLLQQPTHPAQGNPSDSLPSVTHPPNQRLPAGQGGDPLSLRSQVTPPPPGWSTCQAATQRGAKWGGSPNLPKPDGLVWALVGEPVSNRAVLASQGKLGPKGSDMGQEEEGAYLVFSLEMRGSPVMGLRAQERSSRILSHQNFLNTPPNRD